VLNCHSLDWVLFGIYDLYFTCFHWNGIGDVCNFGPREFYVVFEIEMAGSALCEPCDGILFRRMAKQPQRPVGLLRASDRNRRVLYARGEK